MSLRRCIGAALASATLLLALAPTAQAELTFKQSFGTLGSTAGQLANPAGLAVNTSTGDVYVADHDNNRVEQFTSTGTFIRAWGYDVVSAGTHNQPFVNEVDEVRIRATSGSFRLVFQGQETPELPFNAEAGEVNRKSVV
jgi:hypothetical protein